MTVWPNCSFWACYFEQVYVPHITEFVKRLLTGSSHALQNWKPKQRLLLKQNTSGGVRCQRLIAGIWPMQRNEHLSDANLVRANLMAANLEDAELGGVHLVRANLFGANFFGANLSDAELSGAQLAGATMPDGTVHK
jgi:uncharacterized protein YjbI with pentapeptide repeats